jgi:diguanylate cyclase (GGDEF)-like protein
MSEGVSGYAATSGVVVTLAHNRLNETLAGLRSLDLEITERARVLLAAEANEIEELRSNLIVAFTALGMLALSFALAIMRQRNAESRASLARGRLTDAMDNVALGIALFDSEDRLAVRNDRLSQLFPGTADLLVPGKAFAGIATTIGHERKQGDSDGGWTNDVLRPRIDTGPALIELPGHRFAQVDTHPTHEGGTVLVHTDVTRARRAEERLRHLATHDSLTGLPPRRHFEYRLAQSLNASARHGHELTLMFIDIDHFKAVNDTYGHAVGDMVLLTLAKRLRGSLRDHDIVARLSGDEFAVIMENTHGMEQCAATVERILSDVATPITSADTGLRQSVSIGIARYPHDATTDTELMHCADTACYEAKRGGRNTARFYDASRDTK